MIPFLVIKGVLIPNIHNAVRVGHLLELKVAHNSATSKLSLCHSELAAREFKSYSRVMVSKGKNINSINQPECKTTILERLENVSLLNLLRYMGITYI